MKNPAQPSVGLTRSGSERTIARISHARNSRTPRIFTTEISSLGYCSVPSHGSAAARQSNSTSTRVTTTRTKTTAPAPISAQTGSRAARTPSGMATGAATRNAARLSSSRPSI